MVKAFFVFLLIISTLASDELLNNKIKSFIGEDSYIKNKNYIDIVFMPESKFYTQDRINDVNVIETLKENGLLNLFFEKPKELKLTFKTSGSPLFFVKLMGDTLRNLGYYRYVTTQSNLDASEFLWEISLVSEYITDPIILQKELLRHGCSIVEIKRESQTYWIYSIDMSHGYLNVINLIASESIELKRSLYAHWLNVSKIDTLKIESSRRNSWYPYIAYYDASLHLLKVIKKDYRVQNLNLKIPLNTVYIKINDMYTLKNVKDPLILIPKGSR